MPALKHLDRSLLSTTLSEAGFVGLAATVSYHCIIGVGHGPT